MRPSSFKESHLAEAGIGMLEVESGTHALDSTDGDLAGTHRIAIARRIPVQGVRVARRQVGGQAKQNSPELDKICRQRNHAAFVDSNHERVTRVDLTEPLRVLREKPRGSILAEDKGFPLLSG